jgi:hypothetical protein
MARWPDPDLKEVLSLVIVIAELFTYFAGQQIRKKQNMKSTRPPPSKGLTKAPTGIFIAFEESSRRIIANTESFNWKLEELVAQKSCISWMLRSHAQSGFGGHPP